MKSAVIAQLGMSPPVITTFIDGIGEPISDVIMMVTQDPHVIAGARFVDAGLSLKFPWIRVHPELLPFEDTLTEKDNFRFMEITARLFKLERERYHCSRIFLNITGGRKNMSVILTLIGQLLGADGVFHILNPNIQYVNEALERYRSKIEEFESIGSREEGQALYLKRREDYDRLLFPPRESYRLIRIPTLPYPVDFLQYIVNACYMHEEKLSHEDAEKLERHGIIEPYDGKRALLTPYGERLFNVLLGLHIDR